ncbi:KAP family NTPase [Clostridium estertheticum]|uniref:KAP family P-loop NTPase fold protein n=1 Tax=Clostridium estertheticum TaxID=238834 RepID=UPI001C0C3E28|nr:P-loop NTPase fold protein [Clostridium estertheticum]MBU3177648.1 KAP family NTPase [Clostridium estertheticum]
MKLHKNIEIPESEPFQNDKFHREEFINNLMSVLSTYDSGLVLSIDSSWGTGKTTFIKMWEAYLKNNVNFKPIYFNAWGNDDSLDPLVPLISLMSDELKNENGVKFKDRQLYKIGAKIIKKGIPFVLKIASQGLLDVPEISLDSDTEKVLEDYTSKIGETIFEDYKQKSNFKKQFKDALIEYQETINKKVIIFIDELDRCRPLYAIETLERIKHFFDLDNFIFILAMDKTQLAHSVGTIYGNGMDSVGYLRRFIDLEFTLPEPDLNSYIDYLIAQYNMIFDNIEYFWGFLKELAVELNMSLRDIDKLFINLNILIPIIEMFNDKETNFNKVYKMIISSIYVYLVVLKIKIPDDYYKIVYRKYDINDIENLKGNVLSYEMKFRFKNMNNNSIKNIFAQSIIKFLRMNLFELSNIDVYRKEMSENRKMYSISAGEGSYEDLEINLTQIWNEYKQCPIIKNIMFTNNIKI